MIAAETSFALPDLGIVGSLDDSKTSKEHSSIQQLIWQLASVSPGANRETLLNKLIAESYALVGFGPMTSALQTL